MKKLNFLFVIFLLFGGFYIAKSQVRSNNPISADLGGRSVFLDASAELFSNSSNIGKGLVFPRTDLTTFQFSHNNDGIDFPTGYDGMIVFNTGSGITPATRSGVGSQTVEPGFYYFSNPPPLLLGGNLVFSNAGRWVPFTHLATNEISLTGTLSTTDTGLTSETLTLNLSADTSGADVFDFSDFEEVKTGTTSPAGQTFVPAAAVGDLYVDSSTLQLWVYDGAWKLIESAVENLYTDDGTLTGNRIISFTGSNTLSYQGTASNTVLYNTGVRLNESLQDSDGDAGTPGQVLSSTGSKTDWISPAQGLVRLQTGTYNATLADGTILVQPTGAVTINLPTPTAQDNGISLTVKRANSYAGTGDTLAVASTAQFDESTNNLNLNVSYQGYTVQAYNGNWYITQRF